MLRAMDSQIQVCVCFVRVLSNMSDNAIRWSWGLCSQEKLLSYWEEYADLLLQTEDVLLSSTRTTPVTVRIVCPPTTSMYLHRHTAPTLPILIIYTTRQMWTAIPCERLSEISDKMKNYDVIGIDEGQFVRVPLSINLCTWCSEFIPTFWLCTIMS